MENEVIKQLESISDGLQMLIYVGWCLVGFLIRGLVDDFKDYISK